MEKEMKLINIFKLFLLLLSSSVFASSVHDVPVVNGHPGYITAYETSPDGVWDKVLIVVNGFDSKNTSHPIDDINTRFQLIIDQLQPDGWDIVIFDYVRGDIDIKQNADNLADFIQTLDSWAVPDYHLAVLGGSMGGIVTRTMFVQENSSMGVDTYVSLDSPHHGVYLSDWVKDLADVAIDAVAGHQMLNGDPAYNTHYGWLQNVESSAGFMANIINPMNTLAIALSNGENQWKVSWSQEALHTRYHPVSSYVGSSNGQLHSDYMPYHSVVFMDNISVDRKVRWNRNYYWYKDTRTSYFDFKQVNLRDEHAAPDYALKQATDFVEMNGPN